MQEDINYHSLLRALDGAVNALDVQMQSFSTVLGERAYSWADRSQWFTLDDVQRSPQYLQVPNPGFLEQICERANANAFFFSCFSKKSFLRIIYFDGLRRTLLSLSESVTEYQELMIQLKQQRVWIETNANFISLMIRDKTARSSIEVQQLYDNVAKAKAQVFLIIKNLSEKKGLICKKITEVDEEVKAIRRSLFINCLDGVNSVINQILGLRLSAHVWLSATQHLLTEPSFSSSLFYFQCNIMKVIEGLKIYMNQLSIKVFLGRKNSEFFPVKEKFLNLYDLTCALLSRDPSVHLEANRVYNEMQAYSGIYANDDVGRIIEDSRLYQPQDLIHLRDMFMVDMPIGSAIQKLGRDSLRFSSFKYVLVIFLFSFILQMASKIGIDYQQSQKQFAKDHLSIELLETAITKMGLIEIFKNDLLVEFFRYVFIICSAFLRGEVHVGSVPVHSDVREEKERESIKCAERRFQA